MGNREIQTWYPVGGVAGRGESRPSQKRSRPHALEFSLRSRSALSPRDPERVAVGCFLRLRGGATWHDRKFRLLPAAGITWLAGVRRIPCSCGRSPGALAPRSPRSCAAGRVSPLGLLCGPGTEKESVPKNWALCPARGAGWRARRC